MTLLQSKRRSAIAPQWRFILKNKAAIETRLRLVTWLPKAKSLIQTILLVKFSTSYKRFRRFRVRAANLSQKARQLNGFRNHIMWWKGIQINFGIPRENQTFQLIKNLRPPVWKQTPESKPFSATFAIAWAKSFSLFYEQKFLLTSQRRKQCTIQ